jgi:hypothetical protein
MRIVKTNGGEAIGAYGNTQAELVQFFANLYCAGLIPDYTSRFHDKPYLSLGADTFGYAFIIDRSEFARLFFSLDEIPNENFLGTSREPYEMTADFCRKAKREIAEQASEYAMLSAENDMHALAKREAYV